MSDLSGLIDSIPKLPTGVGIAIVVCICIYKIVRHVLDSPLSIATIFGVLAGKERREDARRLVELLCDQRDDGQEAIEGPNQRPPRWWRRRKRRRRGR